MTLSFLDGLSGRHTAWGKTPDNSLAVGLRYANPACPSDYIPWPTRLTQAGSQNLERREQHVERSFFTRTLNHFSFKSGRRFRI